MGEAPDFRGPEDLRNWIESRTRKALDKLHGCETEWVCGTAVNTHIPKLVLPNSSPPESAAGLLSAIRQDLLVARAWALVHASAGIAVPSAPPAFKDREEAQAAVSEWCAFLGRYGKPALGTPALVLFEAHQYGIKLQRLETSLDDLKVGDNHPLAVAAEALPPELFALVRGPLRKIKDHSAGRDGFDRCKTPEGREKRRSAILEWLREIENALRPDSKPGQPEILSGAAREAVLRQLEPADLKAYYAYAFAEMKLGATTDQQAYQWLSDNGLPDEKDSPELAKTLVGYTLPTFATWSKQLRNARRALGEQKHGRRAGRTPGGASVVHASDLDSQPDAD